MSGDMAIIRERGRKSNLQIYEKGLTKWGQIAFSGAIRYD
jgi:hypothetical protein